jgi:hypothetical protein
VALAPIAGVVAFAGVANVFHALRGAGEKESKGETWTGDSDRSDLRGLCNVHRLQRSATGGADVA